MGPSQHRRHGEICVRLGQWDDWCKTLQACSDLAHDANANDLVREETSRLETWANRWLHTPTGDIVIDITAGPGGREASDFVAILARMYCAWAERSGGEIEVVDQDASGWILRCSGTAQAWAMWQEEQGTHRMIRRSPFDPQGRVHTSFAHVRVTEERTDTQIDVAKGDVRTDVMRSSGAGGQHVNKTESAVRLVHKPTGITVVCRQGRSQHVNKKAAWSILLDRIQRAAMAERGAVVNGPSGWGHQIRTYHCPDNRLKNHKTGETRAADQVMSGTLPLWSTATAAPDGPR